VKEIIEMILSCVSVLILIMSPVLSAALVAPNSLSIQEILDYFVNYILINVFILNYTQDLPACLTGLHLFSFWEPPSTVAISSPEEGKKTCTPLAIRTI